MNTEDDAGSQRLNQLTLGLNIRFRGKIIETRQGQTLKMALGAPARWLGSLPVVPRTRLWASHSGCIGVGIGTGCQINHIDPSETPSYQVFSSYIAETNRNNSLATYGTKLYTMDKSVLRELLQITPNAGQLISAILPSPVNIPIKEFTGFTGNCMLEFDGKLFIGLSNDAAPNTTSKIVSWDGTQFIDELTGIRAPQAFGLWRNTIVAGFDATGGNIQWRASGTAPGTWTNVALGGFVCSSAGNAMQEEGKYLWIASGVDKLFRWDGTSLTLQRTIAGCATDGNGCTVVTLHNGILYYGWNTPSAAYASRIGRHDVDSAGGGLEWVDTYQDITGQQANFYYVRALKSYRGQIYAGGVRDWIVATPANDAKGTLVVINNGGGGSGQVQYIVMFFIY